MIVKDCNNVRITVNPLHSCVAAQRYNMYKQYLETCIKSLSMAGRFFIPIVPVHINPNVLVSIMQHTKWLGFNLFDLRESKYYESAEREGIKNTFNIDGRKKIFLTSTKADEKLAVFYNNQNGIEKFKSDVTNFNVDIAMGPDWYAYDDDPSHMREASIKKAFELNEKCIDMENVLPDIHGTNFQEAIKFIKPFKEQGKELFVIAGRGRLINLGRRGNSQINFAGLTSAITKYEGIKLIVTGCSSPKLQYMMPDVLGFAGLGWLIQARNRRLIMGNTYRRISDSKFSCSDKNCCALFTKEELFKPENESIRAIHNLKRICSNLELIPKFRQMCLMNYAW